jgi:hypothetical protein
VSQPTHAAYPELRAFRGACDVVEQSRARWRTVGENTRDIAPTSHAGFWSRRPTQPIGLLIGGAMLIAEVLPLKRW